uniref:Uncharacterized protein n=1 Tax=Anopheles atroparvus TaxID=41427 RepID=A0A182ILV8_ANOAO
MIPNPLYGAAPSRSSMYRTHLALPAVMVAVRSVSVNSRTIVVGFSPFCSWISLLPSRVHTDLTMRPSTVSSVNSSPSLNLMVVFLKVDSVLNVYSSPFFTSSTVGEMLLPSLRSTMPTPTIRLSTFGFGCSDKHQQHPGQEVQRRLEVCGDSGAFSSTAKQSVDTLGWERFPRNLEHVHLEIENLFPSRGGSGNRGWKVQSLQCVEARTNLG